MQFSGFDQPCYLLRKKHPNISILRLRLCQFNYRGYIWIMTSINFRCRVSSSVVWQAFPDIKFHYGDRICRPLMRNTPERTLPYITLHFPSCGYSNLVENFEWKSTAKGVIPLEQSNTVFLTQKVQLPANRAQTRRVRFWDPTRVKAIELSSIHFFLSIEP